MHVISDEMFMVTSPATYLHVPLNAFVFKLCTGWRQPGQYSDGVLIKGQGRGFEIPWETLILMDKAVHK